MKDNTPLYMFAIVAIVAFVAIFPHIQVSKNITGKAVEIDHVWTSCLDQGSTIILANDQTSISKTDYCSGKQIVRVKCAYGNGYTYKYANPEDCSEGVCSDGRCE
jgi:hypothetical protein